MDISGGAKPDTNIRRSSRPVKHNERFSPPPNEVTHGNRGRKRKADGVTDGKKGPAAKIHEPETYTCDQCAIKFIVDPFSTGTLAKKLVPKKTVDPVTRRQIQLCYHCDLQRKRDQKADKTTEDQRLAVSREKEAYLTEARSFADSLVASLGVTNAEKLFCPRFTSKPCRCIQTYLISGGRNENYRKRATFLLKLIKTAQRLSTQKCYDREKILAIKCRSKVGLGNGQKRSKEFEDFVLGTRHTLRTDHNLCEMAIKKLLCYSNNFLFKRLKSEQRECRVEKVQGRGRKVGGLMSVGDIGKWKCCRANCSLMAVTHGQRLQDWRERAARGQAETRRVIAEMLTPSAMRTNCYQFIRQVLGVTSSVISSVGQHLRETGGSWEPAPHGLRTYWAERPRTRDDQHSDDDGATDARTDGRQRQETAKYLELTSDPGLEALKRDTVTPSHSVTEGVTLTDGDVMTGLVTGDHGAAIELVTYVNPDGTTQVIQVPIISCSSLDSDNIAQDVTLQLATDSAHYTATSAHLDLEAQPITANPATYLDNAILESVQVSQDPGLAQSVEILLDREDKSGNPYGVVMENGNFCEANSTEDLVFTNGHMMDRFTLGQAYHESISVVKGTDILESTCTEEHSSSSTGHQNVDKETVVLVDSVEHSRPDGDSTHWKPVEIIPEKANKNSEIDLTVDEDKAEGDKSSETPLPMFVVVENKETQKESPKEVEKDDKVAASGTDNINIPTSESQMPIFVVVDNKDQSAKDQKEGEPQLLIERAQQLIAESQRVVHQSTELAQQPMVQPHQITQQLQQLVGHSEKLVAQQHLTAVQLDQLKAAQSLQQLSSSLQPIKGAETQSKVPMFLPQQRLMNFVNPQLPKASVGIPIAQQMSMPLVVQQKKSPKKALTRAQLLPSVIRKTVPKASSSKQKKERKSTFILPKKTISDAQTITASSTPAALVPSIGAANTQAAQVLVPMVGAGVALTMGTDNKGLPQLLIPCIAKPKVQMPSIIPQGLPTTAIPKVGTTSYASRSNTIILQHPNTNGGSFSVQHVSDNVGVCFHPNSSVQGYVNFPGLAGGIPKDSVTGVMSSLNSTQTLATRTILASDKQHLKDMLPVLQADPKTGIKKQ